MYVTENGTETTAPRPLVSLATYNEVENLRPPVDSIRQHALTAAILVIDDNSPDGTGRLADELKATLPDVEVTHRAGKLGLGTPVLEVMGYVVRRWAPAQLFVPAGFAHGFVVTSGTVAWDDPDLGIDWSVSASVLSAKEREGLRFREIPPGRLPKYQG
jgi:hypothetical protein